MELVNLLGHTYNEGFCN